MIHFRLIRSALTALAVFALTVCSPLAVAKPTASVGQNGKADNSAFPATDDLSDIRSDGSSPTTGNVTELQDLLKAGSLIELRTTHDMGYGAQMYLLSREMVYYIALSQYTRLWRVAKTQDDVRAESVYAQFARKSFDLASGEIRRTQLQAQTALLNRARYRRIGRAACPPISRSRSSRKCKSPSISRSCRLNRHRSQPTRPKPSASCARCSSRVDQLQRQSEAGLTPVVPVTPSSAR